MDNNRIMQLSLSRALCSYVSYYVVARIFEASDYLDALGLVRNCRRIQRLANG